MLSKSNRILAIIGSASSNSTNQRIVEHIATLTSDYFRITIFDELKTLPHFDPELSADHPPEAIVAFRKAVEEADGVIVCTPEYVFSIPSGLKNAIEWCVATTIFSDKPVGLITASAAGQKGHEELQLLFRTLTATFTEESTLLIQGVKGKVNAAGEISDEHTKSQLTRFSRAFREMLPPVK